ncbi:MAG TPA: radical SAM protein [Thermoanaerobaculia bacterium]|nr:radical SAM protein [Thermoanaerobaculia bacterium]
MALFLQADVSLAMREEGVVLCRDGVPVFHVLGVGEALALAFLGATGDAASATALCAECLPDGARYVDRVVDRYWTYLGDGPARELDPEWLERVTTSRPAFPILPMSNVKQEAAPACITWMVTLGCNRKCPYCFFSVFHHAADAAAGPPDATFPLDDAARMVREMARIGTADLYLTGGEPFLRPDLPEVIEEARRRRVRTHAVTKFLISPAFAARLARAGIDSITVSIDDDRPNQAAALAGAPGYLGEATQTVRNLLDAGIDVDVNAVLTKINVDRLEALAAFVADLGVKRLKISPFSTPYPRRVVAERLVTDARVETHVARLQQLFEGRLDIELGGEADPTSEVACGSSIVCEIGSRALDVLPDGSVSRCHYLPGMPELAVGSLRTQTILEIWNGKRLRTLAQPPRELYAGTPCFSCAGHDACNSRGRCYVSALQSNAQLHAPDDFCVREEI